jgi:hypothetical protein
VGCNARGSMVLRSTGLALLALLAVACVATTEDDSVGDHHTDGDEPIGTISNELTATSPVSAAVTGSCSTTAVKALGLQLVHEIQCMQPGSMKSIDDVPGLALGSAVFPYLQTSAADALVAARKARGTTLTINSGLRTLPQQYLLYRWYQTGRCGISLAAPPGASNHESGIAVDIQDNASWRSTMSAKGFAWLGSSDPVHFDYRGAGVVNMKGLSVKAFQRLWNRNHPNDKIDEDGDYGTSTATRLAQAPVGGFPIGAACEPGADKPAPTPPPPPSTSTAKVKRGTTCAPGCIYSTLCVDKNPTATRYPEVDGGEAVCVKSGSCGSSCAVTP